MDVLVLALFAPFAQPANLTSQQTAPLGLTESTIVVRVNNTPITEQVVLRRLQSVYGDVEAYRNEPNRWQRMWDAAVEAEIRDRLLLQAAIADKLKISDEEVSYAHEHSLTLLGKDRFQSMLQQRGATETDFDTFLRERLLIDKYKAKLFKDITIDEQTLRAYYDGHRELFTEPKRVQLEITPVQTLGAASKLLASLKAARKAERDSGNHDDNVAAVGHTQRQWVIIEDLPTALRTPLEVAEAGDVLESSGDNGQIRVIQVITVEDAHTLSFDDISNGLRSTLLRRRQESLLDDWYSQASQQATIEYLPLP